MKKTTYMIFAFSLLLGLCSYGQSKSSFDIGGGYTQDGFAASLGYNLGLGQMDYLKLNVMGAFSNDEFEGQKIPINIYSLDVGYYYQVIMTRSRSLFVGIGGGGTIGYETVNNGEDVLPSGAIILNENGVIYGAFIGAEVDIFLSDKISLVVKGTEYYHLKTDVGNLLPYIGIGIRILTQ
jgi:hypothetical protein